MSFPSQDRITRLKVTLAEVLAKRHLFSEDAYGQIVLALNEKLRLLQTLPPEPEPDIEDADEIRLVTVMFVDVKDSTQISQQLATEDWKVMIDDMHRRLAKVVEGWEGEIGQYLGDGLLCFFGARRSRSDDAMRAVACALALQHTAADYARQIAVQHGVEFALRIGISTGRVVVGVIGTDSKREFVALGATTNLAAHLQRLCPPDRVLIEAQTYHSVRDHFIMQALGPTTIKGVDTPVECFVVLARNHHPAAHLTSSEVAGITLSFSGREAEHRALLHDWHEARRSRRVHITLLYGEPGFGKSRLLQEALASVASEPFVQIIMVARYEQRARAYNLLHDLLTSHCTITETTPMRIAETRIVEYIRGTWTDCTYEAAIIGKLAGFRFAHADLPDYDTSFALEQVAHWLKTIASSDMLLLAVDNLQWADPASLDMLDYLAQALVDQGGVIAAAARSEFRLTNPLYLRAHPHYHDFTLGRLSDQATRAVLNSVLNQVDQVPDALRTHICERAEGNPLFIEEFLRMLFENSIFEPTPSGRWRTNIYQYATMASGLPNGLIGVIQARLDDLPHISRRVVQIASVIGQNFWENAVSQISGFDTTPILNDLIQRGIVVASAQSSLADHHEYRFRHTLYREVAYGMLTRQDREAYHRRAADWLADFVASHPDYLTALAEHYGFGLRREQALMTYVAAARDKLRRGLSADALKVIESGLGSARDVPREIALPLVSRLWMMQGQASLLLKRYGEASAASQTALMLMDELAPEDMIEERAVAARTLDDARKYLGQNL